MAELTPVNWAKAQFDGSCDLIVTTPWVHVTIRTVSRFPAACYDAPPSALPNRTHADTLDNAVSQRLEQSPFRTLPPAGL
jgi:hypothetical protein